MEATVNNSTYSAIVKLSISTVPSQSIALSYTGSAQSPSWNNHNSAELAVGGTTSQTNAGTYIATFTPKSGYQWSDGTITAKNVNWTIGKADGSLSLNLTSLSLTGNAPTGTIAVTRAGNGAITAESSDTAVVTVSVSGTTITVESVSEGSATITVSVSEGTNHLAPLDKTCSVSISDLKATANLSPQVNASLYTDGIADLDVDLLNEFAEAISNNSAITNTTMIVYTDKGNVHRKISVGDTAPISINNENHDAQVMGFNHYDLSLASAYGKTTATGKAGILFQTKKCLGDKYVINSTCSSVGGWVASELRATLNGDIKNTIPNSWSAAFKAVKRKTGAGGTNSHAVNTHDDTLFLPALLEICANREYFITAGENNIKYAYYAAGNSAEKINYRGSQAFWWTSSPHQDLVTFWFFISTTGGAMADGVNSSFCYIAPCFCI